MSDHQQSWRLDLAEERLEWWIQQEKPAQDLVLIVLSWMLSRADDPYQGLQRADGFANYWFGAVPGSDDAAGHVVTCALWIVESEHAVRFDLFSTSTWPI